MTSRVALLALALAASGCAMTPVAARAPSTIALHADGAAWASSLDLQERGALLSADVGYERTGCCNIGLYAATATDIPVETTDKRDQEEEVLDGGLEAGFVVPLEFLRERFQLRARFGKAGTAPQPPLLGRSGYAASIGLLYRLTDFGAPQVDKFGSSLDVALGFAHWGLGRERSAAGAREGSLDHGALFLGLRFGASYGVDFE